MQQALVRASKELPRRRIIMRLIVIYIDTASQPSVAITNTDNLGAVRRPADPRVLDLADRGTNRVQLNNFDGYIATA